MFALILPSRPCLTTPTTLSPTQFAFTFPSSPSFTHIVVFLLPGNDLPGTHAAGVHLQLPGQTQFKFLGAIASDKPSVIFKVTLSKEVQGDVNLGVSVEPVEAVRGQLQALETEKHQQVNGGEDGGGAGVNGSATTKLLAQKIIKNAFNFLAGFSGTVGPGGVEVVPLKSFREWWVKFERKIEMDPGFLERDGD